MNARITATSAVFYDTLDAVLERCSDAVFAVDANWRYT